MFSVLRVTFFLSIFFISTANAKSEKLNLCFFTLNNPLEFKLAKYLIDKKINPYSKVKFSVEEFFPYAEYPEVAFKKLISKGKKCDGLVISGHHRPQGFEGKRATGFLSADWLEKVSCLKKVKPWFEDINAVWLQGCATSKVGHRKNIKLTHRYGRIFPKASLFAWSGSAPSKVAHRTIPYQIANFAGVKLGDNFEYPYKNITPKIAKKMGDAAAKILLGKDIKNAKKAWQKLRRSSSEKSYGIFNASAQSFSPLLDGEYRKSRDIACELHSVKTVDARNLLIEKIIRDKKLIVPNSDLILKEISKRDAKVLKLNIRGKKHLHAVIRQTILDPRATIIDRINLYRVYLELGFKEKFQWTNKLRIAAISQLEKTPSGFDRVESKYYRENIAASLLADLPHNKPPLLRPLDLKKIQDNDTIASILSTLVTVRPRHLDMIYWGLTANPFLDSTNLYTLTWQIRMSGIGNKVNLLNQIANSANVNLKTLDLIKSASR